ncbi:MAG TPA: ribose-5-phosphate isomerase RpiA [Longimicrobiales bacterium]
MSERERQKRRAAERAVEFVEDGMVLGLGTGSTARHVLEVLAERREAGELRRIVGVPTSRETSRLARELGIPLTSLEDEPRLDLTIDGADEVGPELGLIKGLGGALLWEKIVATASDRLVIVVDEGKLVDRLGERAPLPVEVVPFGWTTHLAYLDLLGAQPMLRRGPDGNPFTTDGGHYLLDCRFDEGILEPDRIERELRQRVGVVETGLFLGLADTVVVGGEAGVRVLTAEGV